MYNFKNFCLKKESKKLFQNFEKKVLKQKTIDFKYLSTTVPNIIKLFVYIN